MLFSFKVVCISLAFDENNKFQVIQRWPERKRTTFVFFAAAFLLVLMTWAVVWILALRKTWRYLSMVSYAQTRPIQLAFGFFWRQAILGIIYFVVQYFVVIYGSLFASGASKSIANEDTFATVVSILFRFLYFYPPMSHIYHIMSHAYII